MMKLEGDVFRDDVITTLSWLTDIRHDQSGAMDTNNEAEGPTWMMEMHMDCKNPSGR